MRYRVASFLILTGLLGPMTEAQDEPIASFDDLSEVKEVLFDVIATDESGQTVTGLGKDDFVILEDDEEVDITGVSFYATRYGPGGSLLTADGAVPSSRWFIFFLHDRSQSGSISNYLPRQQAKVRRGCLTWVEEHMLPSDWLAVVSYDRKLKVHQDFTQDRELLAQAIKSAAARRDPERNIGRGGRRLPPLGTPSLLRHLPSGKALSRASRNFYDGMRLIAEAAGYAVGRKNLVLFSPGFGQLDPSGAFSHADRRRYPPMMHALNDHNVAVYAVDLTPFGVRHFQARLMSILAAETGGTYTRDPINFVGPLGRMSDENAGYYLISYQSQRPAVESGFQHVEVRTRDESIEVKARKGYRYGKE